MEVIKDLFGFKSKKKSEPLSFKYFSGKANNKTVLQEKVIFLMPLLASTTSEVANGIPLDMFQLSAPKQEINRELFFDILCFNLSLFDRFSHYQLKPEERGSFMDLLVLFTFEEIANIINLKEKDKKDEFLKTLLQRLNEILFKFAKMKDIFPVSVDQSFEALGSCLYGAFSEYLANKVCGENTQDARCISKVLYIILSAQYQTLQIPFIISGNKDYYREVSQNKINEDIGKAIEMATLMKYKM